MLNGVPVCSLKTRLQARYAEVRQPSEVRRRRALPVLEPQWGHVAGQILRWSLVSATLSEEPWSHS
jgi:hypothetical protein